ncbi:MAG TPA: DNA repair protein RecO [Pseudomonadales bacterium]|nr:DNA repair protein RecO [Pseudomonadales bacterium]
MTRRIADEPAYVLHARPYRETSAIVDLLTLRFGRVSAVARGVRGGRRGASPPRPFSRLAVACSGRAQLLTLNAFDVHTHRWLTGDALYAGLYLNELLLRLLRDDDAHPAVFDGYERALDALDADAEPALRRFERLLLKECGYEITFDCDADSGAIVEADACYRFVPDVGFQAVDEAADQRHVFAGATLHAIDRDDYADADVRRAAKQIMRRALAPHLGDRPIGSRALYRNDPYRHESAHDGGVT